MTLEGNGAARWIQIIKKHGFNAEVSVELAKVTTIPPSLAIKLNRDGLALDMDDLIVADHLLEHERKVTLNGGAEQTMIVKSPLKVGDEVIVLATNDNQLFYVIDRAVV